MKNGKEDLVLTALVNYYTQGYYTGADISLEEDDNLFEYYLYLASNNESVLSDLLYLKEENDIDNYNKLLVTLSLEFVGDYQNAKGLYNSIELKDDEKDEYSSLIAIIDTFINKDIASAEINELIESNPSDEYLRFAILSFFENNSTEIAEEESVTISYGETTETVTFNGMEIKTYDYTFGCYA